MGNFNSTTNLAFKVLVIGEKKGVMLSKITKAGTPGNPSLYEFYGSEKTAEDVIARMEKLNPGSKWVEA